MRALLAIVAIVIAVAIYYIANRPSEEAPPPAAAPETSTGAEGADGQRKTLYTFCPGMIQTDYVTRMSFLLQQAANLFKGLHRAAALRTNRCNCLKNPHNITFVLALFPGNRNTAILKIAAAGTDICYCVRKNLIIS